MLLMLLMLSLLLLLLLINSLIDRTKCIQLRLSDHFIDYWCEWMNNLFKSSIDYTKRCEWMKLDHDADGYWSDAITQRKYATDCVSTQGVKRNDRSCSWLAFDGVVCLLVWMIDWVWWCEETNSLCSINSMIDWMIDWMNEKLIVWVIDWLIDQLIHSLTELSFCYSTDWLIGWSSTHDFSWLRSCISIYVSISIYLFIYLSIYLSFLLCVYSCLLNEMTWNNEFRTVSVYVDVYVEWLIKGRWNDSMKWNKTKWIHSIQSSYDVRSWFVR
jgi:hypothetical protein